jgi:hypothetical protein
VTELASNLGNPLLYADALIVRSSIRLPQFVITAPYRRHAASTPSDPSDNASLRDVEAVVSRLARDVLPQAEAMGYAALVNRAHAHLGGKTPYAFRAETEVQDEDVLTAAMTDEQVHQMAIRFLRAYRLPQERLAVMERDVLAHRCGA